tara:strand:+ start:303 stop:758 length:456 start_codon:yes stop_codon:yes gene_type:complete
MYKIYLIRDIHGLKYVGITKQTIKKRLQNHEADLRRGKYCSSHKLDLTCCKITILEDDITEENKKEKEQYWIDKIDCVNDYNAIIDLQKRKENKKQYYEEHKEEKKEELKEELKEEHREYQKKHRDYQISWGGRICYNNNSLLKIDIDLFK